MSDGNRRYISGMIPFPRALLIALCFLLTGSVNSQMANPYVHSDPMEVRLAPLWETPNEGQQSQWRKTGFWSQFKAEHPLWQAQFHPATATVHRAYGPAIPASNPTDWLEEQLEFAGWSSELGPWNTVAMGKHNMSRSVQMVEGRVVLGTEFVVKTAESGVVMWGAQCFENAAWPEDNAFLGGQELMDAATAGLDLSSMMAAMGEESLLPVLEEEGELRVYAFRPVKKVQVSGTREDGTPVQYATWVDMVTGQVWERQNQVRHIGKPHGKPAKKQVLSMGSPAMLQTLNCQITGTVHLTQPFEEAVEVGLENLWVQTQQGAANTAQGGMLTLDGDAPQQIGLDLMGLWSTVTSNGVTPNFEVTLEGDEVVTWDGTANIRELSAYHSVNRIHDHMQSWLPGFDGLDFALPTLIDVSGTCNAFYTPGDPSINFYSEGDGCNAFSLVADVVFHEYGHGINDLFYESLGSSFINGAMGEGYADLWAISLSENPILGEGCYSDDAESYIRRYDMDPKVYPQDLVGQVHADGEIICGAWYDTHLLMGGDWNLTRELFVEAYAGLQATNFDGNEGEAYVEVLLDVLQADDDNADLSDGTPNGAAILEGFGIHGITLFSNVDIGHVAEEYSPAGDPIVLDANALVLFPFSQYFGSCNVYYRSHVYEDWTEMPMVQTAGSTYSADIPAQETGTVLEYHFGITDIYGSVSAITPYSADNAANPNLPFNTIVGLSPVLIDDQDDYSEFGFWQLGLPEDNATTGQWESAIPVGSFSNPGDPSSICAPDEDHTPGDGIYAFITGVSPGADAGIGSNDVDEGSTTLQSESIDLTGLTTPVLSYWRWYVNAPASGANPGADWWQVSVSSDGGENWIKVEETLTQDISWRRNAFSIEDYVPLTDAFQIRFTASDSLRPDQGLQFDGGSLIEAAVDDLIIHDFVTSGLANQDLDHGIVAWPVPFSDRLHAAGWNPGTNVRLLDALGKEVAKIQAGPLGEVHFDTAVMPSGVHVLEGENRQGILRRKEVVRAGN